MIHPALRPSMLAITIALTLGGCSKPAEQATTTVVEAPKLTAADAEKFVADAETNMEKLGIESARTDWVAATYITDDTEQLSAKRSEELTTLGVQLANGTKQFLGMPLAADVARKMDKIRLGLTLPAPSDAAQTAELSKIVASLNAQYGKGKYCKTGTDNCMALGDLEDIIGDHKKHKPAEILEAWQGWHDSVGGPMRADYQRMVEIANAGSKELGFADTGALWRSKYDMPADDFAKELDRLWEQVKPLYQSLHCYVRGELNQKYGEAVVPATGPIPAHMLGNMWAQEWGNIYDEVKPQGASVESWTKALEKKYGAPTKVPANQIKDWKLTAEGKMVQTGEAFFSSMGFAPLPDSFWTHSQFIKPMDHDAVCHASAWDIDNQDDLRVKMCIKVDSENFVTIHHELGHNYYQRAYKDQSFLYKDAANDGFHEAIGDTIALSITPSYLKQMGLIEKEPEASQDVALLMQRALDKVAFLPFGLLVDQWRWKVFSGEIKPQDYNSGWWQLREKYQGVKAPVARDETQFDAGAKYHVPGNTPYSRYFLADILQFQFYRSMCQQAGFQGPLHRCSFFGNKEVGERFNKMLAMGASKPWQDALETMTGKREMDASAVTEYFAPLKEWLDQKNMGRQCGWEIKS